MASPLVEYCEQANPGVLADIRKLGGAGGRSSQVSVQRTDANLGYRRDAQRIQASILAGVEKRALIWMAERTPAWINSDHLTALGLIAQIGAGVGYALSRGNRFYLLAVIGCLALNWLGDSLDGTLARLRRQQRPRYGFYVDHMVDSFGAVAMMGGLALSGYMRPWIAMGLLVAFLVLSIQSYLATYTLGEFRLSFWSFGPTELRLLLAVGNLALLRWPVVLHHHYRLFDIGGVIGLAGMTLMIVYFTAKNGYRLYCEERIR
jgi:archaetidylinositol phosphate synthase